MHTQPLHLDHEWAATRTTFAPLGVHWNSRSGQWPTYRFAWPTIATEGGVTMYTYSFVEVTATAGALALLQADRASVEDLLGIPSA